MFKNDQVFNRKKEISWRIVDGEGVILNLATGAYYSMNPVGLNIWKHCDGKKRLKDIKSLIAKEYRIDETKAGQDVERFLKELQKNDLIKTAV